MDEHQIEQMMDEEDSRAALSVPALQTTTVAPMYRGDVVRLAFGESIDGFTRFHSAVALPRKMARTVAQGMIEMLDKMDADEAEDGGHGGAADATIESHLLEGEPHGHGE